MKTLLSCEFNMDTACVELKYSDGSKIFIDTIAREKLRQSSRFQMNK